MKEINILICGLGRMGRVHEKYINEGNLNYYWYDPFLSEKDDRRIESLEDIKSLKITHVIISTPEGTHYPIYKSIRDISKNIKILVEKPAVTEKDNFEIFKDRNVFVGLVERFNPAIKKLKSIIDKDLVLNIDFVRCSISQSSNQRVNSFTDVGIHDIDLMFYLLESQVSDYRVDHISNTFSLITNHAQTGAMCRFLWSNETFSKERKIIVRQKNCTYEADLIDQTVKKYSSAASVTLTNINGTISENLYVEKSSSIKEQLKNFICENSFSVKGENSHSFYLSVKDFIERIRI